jgi:hypothetical protein
MNIVDDSIDRSESIVAGNKIVIGINTRPNKFGNLNGESNKGGTKGN